MRKKVRDLMTTDVTSAGWPRPSPPRTPRLADDIGEGVEDPVHGRFVDDATGQLGGEVVAVQMHVQVGWDGLVRWIEKSFLNATARKG